MGKWIKRIIIVVLVFVFLFSVGMVGMILYRYWQVDQVYAEAAEQFVRPSTFSTGTAAAAGETAGTVQVDGEEPVVLEYAPLEADFAALQEANPDIVGWLYCEDTVINYPVLHGADDDMYLRHLYDHTYSNSGSIFVEAANRKRFQDANTIIYGHNMHNDTMFGTLDEWADQEYYETHPVLWLLTPEQDYKIEIIAAYRTTADSSTYTIFSDVGPEIDAYIASMTAQSAIQTAAQPETDTRYVLLSTCADSFSSDIARFVVHGKLTPVASAGGVQIM